MKFPVLVLLLGLLLNGTAQPPFAKDLLSADVERTATIYKSEIYFRKAQVFFGQKNWDSVLSYSMMQLTVNADPALADYCHYFRAISFKHKRLFSEAQRELRRISPAFRFYGQVIINQGNLYLEQAAHRKALDHYLLFERLPDSIRSGIEESAFYHNIGICYLHLGRFDSSETWLQKAAALQQEKKDTAGLTVSLMDLGNLYYEQFMDRRALFYFERAYRMSKYLDNAGVKATAAYNMSVAEENRHHFPQALAYRKEYEAWNDSLNNQNKIWALAEQEKKFALQHKQNELDVLAAGKRLRTVQRNHFIKVSLLLVALLSALVYFYLQKTKQNRIIAVQRNGLEMLNKTKDWLFSVIGHDLRSTANALKTNNGQLVHQLASVSIPSAQQALQRNGQLVNGMAHLLDNLLHWALLQTRQLYFHPQPQSLFHTIEHAAYNYKLMMQQKHIRFENRVGSNMLVQADQESLKIVLRNLLDNAVKFTNEHGAIIIYTRSSTGNSCVFVVEDSGPGIPAHEIHHLLSGEINGRLAGGNQPGTGLGLQLCRAMIQRNGGSFSMESPPGGGARMVISLPQANEHE